MTGAIILLAITAYIKGVLAESYKTLDLVQSGKPDPGRLVMYGRPAFDVAAATVTGFWIEKLISMDALQ